MSSRKAKKKNPRTVLFRVTREGTLAPADQFASEELRRRKFRVGDTVSADPKHPRNPKAWSRAHKLAQLLIENLDEFTNQDAHGVLKRLQFEGDIACEYMDVKVPGYGIVTQRWPKSLAYDQMDEGEFQEVYAQLCQHIIDQYWPELSEDEIADMASLVGAAA